MYACVCLCVLCLWIKNLDFFVLFGYLIDQRTDFFCFFFCIGFIFFFSGPHQIGIKFFRKKREFSERFFFDSNWKILFSVLCFVKEIELVIIVRSTDQSIIIWTISVSRISIFFFDSKLSSPTDIRQAKNGDDCIVYLRFFPSIESIKWTPNNNDCRIKFCY